MKSRKRLCIAFGALCALAVLVGWLARPEDELAGIMQLHPTIEVRGNPNEGPVDTVYSFRVSPFEVARAVHGRIREPRVSGVGAPDASLELRNGRFLDVLNLSSHTHRPDGIKCVVYYQPDDWPWYDRAWATIKYRLGL